MATRETSRPLTSVLTQVVSEVAYLLQTEIRLARAELNEKVNHFASGGAMIGIGAILALAGLFVVLLAVVAWLAVAGLPEEWGLLLVGGVVLAAGAGIAMKGVNDIKSSDLVPNRTIEQVKADYSVVKEQVK
jgi:uncharacterized membrane protein YqjE